MREVLRDVELSVAAVNARWTPSRKVFTYPIDDATTVLEFKGALSRDVGCEAHNMQLLYGIMQLCDDVPLSQYVRHGDMLLAKPKTGG